MKLINTTTLEVQEFPWDEHPEYAIISYEGIDLSLDHPTTRKCCDQAASHQMKWVWMNCCVDKNSYIEVSESIHSLWHRYRKSSVCIVYLDDVPANIDNLELPGSTFWLSKWFRSGWTLAALLAPVSVVFYDEEWNEVGNKFLLDRTIIQITGIPDLPNYQLASVGQKISWMANRETKREEELAYALMGLFDIHLPINYGEGQAAFIRLQEEIIQTCEDETIFAWSSEVDDGRLFATSPKAFKDCANIVQSNTLCVMQSNMILDFRKGPRRWPYSMTNRGLHAELCIVPTSMAKVTPNLVWIAPLLCQKVIGAMKFYVVLLLAQRNGVFSRAAHAIYVPVTSDLEPRTLKDPQVKELYISRRNITRNSPNFEESDFSFIIKAPDNKPLKMKLRYIGTMGNVHKHKYAGQIHMKLKGTNSAMVVVYEVERYGHFLIRIGCQWHHKFLLPQPRIGIEKVEDRGEQEMSERGPFPLDHIDPPLWYQPAIAEILLDSTHILEASLQSTSSFWELTLGMSVKKIPVYNTTDQHAGDVLPGYHD